MSEDYMVPYICPNCDHDRWVSTQGKPGGQKVKCPECGQAVKSNGRCRWCNTCLLVQEVPTDA